MNLFKIVLFSSLNENTCQFPALTYTYFISLKLLSLFPNQHLNKLYDCFFFRKSTLQKPVGWSSEFVEYLFGLRETSMQNFRFLTILWKYEI